MPYVACLCGLPPDIYLAKNLVNGMVGFKVNVHLWIVLHSKLAPLLLTAHLLCVHPVFVLFALMMTYGGMQG